jgi:sugar-phosphatase
MRHRAIQCQAILFDLDGVLVDSMGLIERILREWAAGHGLDGDKVIELSRGRRDVDVVRLIAPHLDADAETHRIVEREQGDFHGLAATPEAARLLDALPLDALGVVTSGTRVVAQRRLAAAGFPPPTHLVAADDIQHGKPDPEGYLTAARLLDVIPAQCVVVEDAPAGVRAAHAAGMRCIGVGGALTEVDTLLSAQLANLRNVHAASSRQGLQLTVACLESAAGVPELTE